MTTQDVTGPPATQDVPRPLTTQDVPRLVTSPLTTRVPEDWIQDCVELADAEGWSVELWLQDLVRRELRAQRFLAPGRLRLVDPDEPASHADAAT